jgi:hypothetical protein
MQHAIQMWRNAFGCSEQLAAEEVTRAMDTLAQHAPLPNKPRLFIDAVTIRMLSTDKEMLLATQSRITLDSTAAQVAKSRNQRSATASNAVSEHEGVQPVVEAVLEQLKGLRFSFAAHPAQPQPNPAKTPVNST